MDRAKWHRGQGKGAQRLKVDRTRRPGQKDNRDYNKWNEELKIVVKALGRLVLHQEDSMSVLRVDTEMVAFMKNRGPNIDGRQPLTREEGKRLKTCWAAAPNVLLSAWLAAIKFRIQELPRIR